MLLLESVCNCYIAGGGEGKGGKELVSRCSGKSYMSD